MKTRGKVILPICLLGLIIFLGGCVSNDHTVREVFFDVPRQGQVGLQPIGELPAMIDESSGLVQSGRLEDVFWTHNDSGDQPRLFAIDAIGELISPESGVVITNAQNRDWEGIAKDFQGNLLIGDFGNNANKRQDLTIYVLPEPDPRVATRSTATAQWRIHYPDQEEFPPARNNFDCEAMFVSDGEIYLVTKHRADSMATLYRLDTRDENRSNELTLLSRMNVRGQVTAADSWNDGERVALLTYMGVWVFDPPDRDGSRLVEGRILWLPIRAFQAEAVAFLDRDNLMITNEQRGVYHLPISEMKAVTVRTGSVFGD
ncbi:MAG: hypothetical protein AAFX93_06770 [Verrucomicrobiota bacterium]